MMLGRSNTSYQRLIGGDNDGNNGHDDAGNPTTSSYSIPLSTLSGTYSTAQSLEDKVNQALARLKLLESDQREAGNEVQRVVREQALIKQIKRETNQQWYPLILWFIAVNFFLWIALFYAIFDIDQFRNDRMSYITYTCLICILPLAVVSFFIFSPYPHSMKQGRDRFSEKRATPRSKNLINIVNAAGCFIVVVAYIWTSAIPYYNTPRWFEQVEFTNNISIPAFAWIFPDRPGSNFNYAVNFTYFEGYPKADFWVSDAPSVNLGKNYSYTYRLPYGEGEFVYGLVVNSSGYRNSVSDPVGNFLLTNLLTTYNSSRVQDQWYDSQVLFVPFDPRLSVEDILSCGIQSIFVANAFAFNSFSLNVVYTADALKSVQLASPNCTRKFQDMASDPNNPLAIYDLTLTGTTSSLYNNISECDLALHPESFCQMSIRMAYGSQYIKTHQTEHGISKLDIWVNVGAIVGAVQFFAWFLLQAFGG